MSTFMKDTFMPLGILKSRALCSSVFTNIKIWFIQEIYRESSEYWTHDKNFERHFYQEFNGKLTWRNVQRDKLTDHN